MNNNSIITINIADPALVRVIVELGAATTTEAAVVATNAEAGEVEAAKAVAEEVEEVAPVAATTIIPTGIDRLTNPTWLAAMYIDARCSIQRMGCVLGVADFTIKTALLDAGIALRINAADQPRFPKLRDDEYLFDALVTRGLCLREIGREVGCAEQTVNDAVRRPSIALRLAAANWKPGRSANRTRTGRPTSLPFPNDETIVEIAARLAGDDWAAETAIRAEAGLTESQHHSFRRKCAELVVAGHLEMARMQLSPRHRQRVVYRPAR
jgi:hypothetical protein